MLPYPELRKRSDVGSDFFKKLIFCAKSAVSFVFFRTVGPSLPGFFGTRVDSGGMLCSVRVSEQMAYCSEMLNGLGGCCAK